MKSMKKLLHGKMDYKNKLFSYFLLSITVIVLIFGMVIYGNVRKILVDEAKLQSKNTVIQLKNSTEFMLDEVQNYIKQITYDTQVQNLADNYDSMSYVDIKNFNDRFSSLFAANKYMKSCVIYYFDDNKVWSQTESWLGLVDLDNYKQNEFVKEIYSTYKKTEFKEAITYDEFGRPQLTFVVPTAQYIFSPKAVAIISIDLRFFKDLLGSMEIDKNANISIVNANRQLISTLSNVNELEKLPQQAQNQIYGNKDGSLVGGSGKNESLLTYAYSSKNGWHFIYSVTTDAIYKKVDFIKNIIFIIILTFFVLGMVISFFASKRLYSPISTLIDIIKNSDKRENVDLQNDMEYLNSNVKNLISSKNNLEEALSDSMPILKNSFIMDMLNNEVDKDSLWDRLNFYNSNIKDNCFYSVGIISVDHYETIKSEYSEKQLSMLAVYQSQLIFDAISSFENINLEILKVENCRLILIFSVNKAEAADVSETINQFMDKVHKQISENMKFTVTIGVGNIYDDIAKISISYKEAHTALGYRVLKDYNSIIRISEFPGCDNWNYIYSDEIEKGIAESIQQCDLEKLLDASDKYFEYIGKNILRSVDIKYAFVHLLDINIRCLSAMGLDFYEIVPESENLYKHLLGLETIKEADEWFRNNYVKIIEYINSKKENRQSKIVIKTKEYIDNNFMSPDINLDILSQELHFSESYLGKLFRNEMGMPIKEYITYKRVEEAKRLIETTEKTIKEIAKCVGYENDRSFINIFKKSEGKTPGEYRNQVIKKI